MYSVLLLALYCLLSAPVHGQSCPAATWDRMDDGSWSAVVSTSAEFTHVDVTWTAINDRFVVPDMENACASALVAHSYSGTGSCLTGMSLQYLTEGLWNCSSRTEAQDSVSYDFTSTFYIFDDIEGENRTQSKSVPITLTYSTSATWSAYGFDAADRAYDATISQSFTIVVDQSGTVMPVGEVVSQIAAYLSISRDYVVVNASSTASNLMTSLLVLTYDPNSGITPTVALYQLLRSSPATLAVSYVLLTPTFNRPQVQLRFPSQRILINNSTRALDVIFQTYTSYPGSLTNMTLDTPLTVDGISIDVSEVSSVFYPEGSSILQTWTLHFVVPSSVCSFDLPLISYYTAVGENTTTTYQGQIGFSLSISNLCPTVQSQTLTAAGILYSDSNFTEVQNSSLQYGIPAYALVTLQGNRAINSAQIELLTVNDQTNAVLATIVTANVYSNTPAVTYSKLYDSALANYQYTVRFEFAVHSGYFIQGQPLFMNAKLSVVYSGTKRQSATDSAQVSLAFRMAAEEKAVDPSTPGTPGSPGSNSASSLSLALAATVATVALFVL